MSKGDVKDLAADKGAGGADGSVRKPSSGVGAFVSGSSVRIPSGHLKEFVVIAGGGNAAHVLVAELAKEGHDVRLYAPFADEAEKFKAGLASNGGAVDCTMRGKVVSRGAPSVVSKDPAEAAKGATLVLLPVPSFAHESLVKALAPHVADGAAFVALPGQGGFDYRAREWLGGAAACRKRKLVFGATSQLPYQCRFTEYGAKVDLLGHKTTIGCGAWPPEEIEPLATLLTNLIIRCRVEPLPHMCTVTLMPANQVIHTSIMHGLFKEWRAGESAPYDAAPLFYQGCTDEMAATMDGMSDDIGAVCKAIESQCSATLNGAKLAVPRIDAMMRMFYGDEIVDPSCTRTIFATNKGYEGLTAPMKKRESDGKFEPNFGYRYLTEDIPLGLCVIKGIAQLAGVATPTVDKVVTWAQGHMGKEYIVDGELKGADVASTGAPQAHGIKSLAELVE